MDCQFIVVDCLNFLTNLILTNNQDARISISATMTNILFMAPLEPLLVNSAIKGKGIQLALFASEDNSKTSMGKPNNAGIGNMIPIQPATAINMPG